jgi:asparagine synthase (glutamine-hydrolysing)
MLIQSMNDNLLHRGPNHSAIWFNPEATVALGNTRLAIIDMHSSGNQPMISQDGRFVIVYNGEVYNYPELRKQLINKGYTFRSHSDTEVILVAYQEWGKHCLERFNGMFAFGIWDNQQQELFLGRDRIGEKPLFIYQDEHRFVFASELKSLWAGRVPKKLNFDFLRNYIVNGRTYNYFDLSETFYHGVKKLKAAHYLVVNKSKDPQQLKYWNLSIKQPRNVSLQESVETYKALFTESLRMRLNADTEVASCLSGGLDSSSIVCLSRALGHDIQTFSARFNDPDLDEGRYLRAVIPDESKHTDILMSEDKMAEVLDEMFFHQETPFHGASYLSEFLVMKEVNRKGIKVLLDGQGADETLIGYEAYFETLLRQILVNAPATFRHQLQLLRNNTQHKGQYGLKFFIKSIWPNLFRKLKDTYYTFQYNSFLHPEFLQNASSIHTPDYIYHNISEHLHRNCVGGDLEFLLTCSDRSSMAFGVEARMPFLDHTLIEYLNETPVEYRIHNFQTKYLHRQAMKGIVPELILNRKDKNGYAAPQQAFMNHPIMQSEYQKSLQILTKEKITKPQIQLSNMDLKWRIIMAAKLLK